MEHKIGVICENGVMTEYRVRMPDIPYQKGKVVYLPDGFYEVTGGDGRGTLYLEALLLEEYVLIHKDTGEEVSLEPFVAETSAYHTTTENMQDYWNRLVGAFMMAKATFDRQIVDGEGPEFFLVSDMGICKWSKDGELYQLANPTMRKRAEKFREHLAAGGGGSW